jgi:hypothetical protein
MVFRSMTNPESFDDMVKPTYRFLGFRREIVPPQEDEVFYSDSILGARR